MSKAVLVMDMPEKCAWCPLGRLFGTAGASECRAAERVNRDCESVPDWCPLCPMPEKKQLSGDVHNVQSMAEEISAASWNSCIDAIGGMVNE